MIKKLSTKESEKFWIEHYLYELLKYNIATRNYEGIIFYLHKHYKYNFIIFNNLDKNIIINYGQTNDPNDIKIKIAKILFLCNCFEKYIDDRDRQDLKYRWIELFIKIQKQFEKTLYNYKINWKNFTFESKIKNTIIYNIKDTKNFNNKEINDLLKPLNNENEIYGLMIKLRVKIKSINFKMKKNEFNLSDIEKSIFKNAYNLANILINNKVAHENEKLNKLNIKDISYNFALCCSLIFKLTDEQ